MFSIRFGCHNICFGWEIRKLFFCNTLFTKGLYNFMNLDQWFRRWCLKLYRIYGSCSHFVQWNGNICAILVEGIIGNFLVKIFWIWTSSSGDFIENISYLELWGPICSVEQIHLCYFSRGHYEEHFCWIIFNLDKWFRRRFLKKKFMDGRRLITIAHHEPLTQVS